MLREETRGTGVRFPCKCLKAGNEDVRCLRQTEMDGGMEGARASFRPGGGVESKLVHEVTEARKSASAKVEDDWLRPQGKVSGRNVD